MFDPLFPYIDAFIYFVTAGFFLWLHIKYSTRFANWLTKKNENPFWINLDTKFNPILTYILSIICLFGSIHRIPVFPLYKSYILGIIVIVWTLLALNHLFKTFPKASPSRVVAISTLTLFALYGQLVAFEKVPSVFEIPHYLNTLPPLTQALLHLPFSLIIAAMVYGGLSRLIYEFVRKSDSAFDDVFYKLFRLPITVSIVYLGMRDTLNATPINETARSVLISISSTITIAVWFFSFWKGVEAILSIVAQNHPEKKFKRLYPLFTLLGKTIVLLIGVYWFLTAWGVDPTATLASAGIAGIALAYASQDTLGSLFAGITIISDAPFKLGDFLILEDGSKGVVTQIGFRSTRLLTPENVEIVIPNSIMANSKIKNMSGGSIKFARVDCSAGVAYGSDVDQVREILLQIGNELPFVHHDDDLKPKVHFISMGDSSLDFLLRVWIDDPSKLYDVQDEANTRIYKAFKAANIEIPYNKQDVYLYPMGNTQPPSTINGDID